MSKRKKPVIGVTVLCVWAAALMLLSACALLTFYCDRCHRQSRGQPHNILVHSVDMTVCDECYAAYLNGEWSSP